jgi:hypothetical protein
LSAFGENFKTWRVKQGKQNLTISFRWLHLAEGQFDGDYLPAWSSESW